MVNKKQKLIFSKKGFTIIETMISVSLFIVITTVGMGSLLSANLVYQKSRDMRNIMDSLSHAMEDLSRNARTGYDYHCFETAIGDNSTFNTPLSCPLGGMGVAFEHDYGDQARNDDQWVYYIEEVQEGQGARLFKSTDGMGSYVQMTPDEVKLDLNSSYFVVSGAEAPDTEALDGGDQNQPIMTIRLSGNILYKGVPTPFSLQTTVSQRLLDF